MSTDKGRDGPTEEKREVSRDAHKNLGDGDQHIDPSTELQAEPDADSDPPRGGVGLRVAVYVLSVLLAISVAASALLHFIDGPQAVEQMTAPDADVEPMLFLWLRLATLPVVIAVTLFFITRLDKRHPREIGLCLPAASGGHGLLACLGAAVSLFFWLLLADPWMESTLVDFSSEDLMLDPWLPVGASGLLSVGLGFLGLAFLDELIFRGYVYTAFRERFAWVHAAGLANLLSVALFAGHPQIEAAGVINAFLLGLALAAMRERTGSLLMPSLFLAFWNFLLGCGLSLPVSGSLFPRLYNHQISGPVGVTGGDFGPEGSWLLTGILLGLVMMLAWWVEKDVEPSSSTSDPAPA